MVTGILWILICLPIWNMEVLILEALNHFYKKPFLITDIEEIDGIRMAAVEDVIAMKMNVISHGGRKKDFWDIHFVA